MDLYVLNNDRKLVYQIVKRETFEDKVNHLLDIYHLELVYGWDYVDDDTNVQGWVSADRFIFEVQSESITVIPFNETLKDRIEEEGYTFTNSPKMVGIKVK